MKTNTHVSSYLAQGFLEWKMFQKKVVEKIKTLLVRSKTSFSRINVTFMFVRATFFCSGVNSKCYIL